MFFRSGSHESTRGIRGTCRHLKMLFLVGHVLRATEMRSFFDNKKSTKMIAILKSPLIASKIPKILNLKASQSKLSFKKYQKVDDQ